MKKFMIVFALIAGVSSSAFAWGEREQGALIGVAGTLLVQHFMDDYRDTRRDSRSSNIPNNRRQFDDGYEDYYERPSRRRPAGVTVIPPRNGAATLPPIRIPQYECSTEDLYNSYGEYITSRQICQ
jgi:hypothetical protein